MHEHQNQKRSPVLQTLHHLADLTLAGLISWAVGVLMAYLVKLFL